MPQQFDTRLPPFDRLSDAEQQRLSQSLDIVYFRAGETVINAGSDCQQLYIIIKGNIEEHSDSNSNIPHHDEPHTYAHYANDDLFDVSAQLKGISEHSFTAREDTLCYSLPRQWFVDSYQANPQFAAYFDTNLTTRQALLEEAQQQQNLAEFILTKIDDDNIQPCLLVPATASLLSVTKQMQQQNIDAAFVAMPNRTQEEIPNSATTPHHEQTLRAVNPQYGIVTRTDLLHAIMLDGHDNHTSVATIATAPVISIEKGDYLFNAMLAMTRHKVKRVLVFQQQGEHQQVVGMLDLTQVLSLFSTHSHVLTLRIARAQTIDELALAANSQQTLVETLFNNGIRTLFVMELIATVNEQIIEKAFQLIVPTHLQPHFCFMVMGSEGRGEQILKTDQDNALIIANDTALSFNNNSDNSNTTEHDPHHTSWSQCHAIMQQLTHTLQQLGYPLCPGKVMVNNPHWVQSQHDWLKRIDQLCEQGDPQSLMELAILADSHAVAGQKSLLTPLLERIHQHLSEHEVLLTTFTRPALQFSVPLTLFGNLKASKQGLNIKQGGIFPIVHGVRALALEHHISATNTFTRLQALANQRVLEQSTADNLSEALKLFIKLRLQQQLSQAHDGLHHHIDISQLARVERDLLRHSLHVVKKFKEWLGYRYQIRD
ncbi:cyclic nucleotide-binding protein [Photobacterium jeanii]|uniref:Cyclic nucleotide-binding protein n=1 Tax=Photobacterium jeanii TaxID=858640 RepID=A0A178KIV9_9GAMM|nr:putative nucleotidyltransferase substrate binding domain-containing protein [Photobacterium jeanii]OAN16693.1 cyclic nucleotide-binding protein [Photobacterium jeanii]PST87422.1 cyclic nucleotide-binding/CBS domain-containing protein [Photobacterium jeanii]